MQAAVKGAEDKVVYIIELYDKGRRTATDARQATVEKMQDQGQEDLY